MSTTVADQPSSTFGELWDAAVVAHGDEPFLLFRSSDGVVTEWTYRKFDTAVERVVARLDAFGVGPGQSVHLALRNCPAFVALWLAVTRIGAWMVPVDPASVSRDIRRQIERVSPAVGFCGADRAEAYREGTRGSGLNVVELNECAADLEETGALWADTVGAWRPVVDPSDRIAVMFTSGTTAEPKGVLLTQANYVSVARTMSRVVDLESRHRWSVTLPLFHANAQYFCFASAIAAGASVALSAGFSASGWVAQARELDVTHVSLFAAPIRMILARTPPGTPPLQLQHAWFAQNLSREHHERFADLVGTRPRQLYGMTETLAIVCSDTR
ncbi:MAG: AMP-binding protein, partial [Actinomycetota bacterium]|nr:AMP-binding protein [Actinomycetota bacterium]